jgi:hypothetical protein
MNVVSDLIGAIKAEQATITESIVNGFVVNFETYQRLVGQHQGLAKALDLLNDLLNEKDN